MQISELDEAMEVRENENASLDGRVSSLILLYIPACIHISAHIHKPIYIEPSCAYANQKFAFCQQCAVW